MYLLVLYKHDFWETVVLMAAFVRLVQVITCFVPFQVLDGNKKKNEWGKKDNSNYKETLMLKHLMYMKLVYSKII